MTVGAMFRSSFVERPAALLSSQDESRDLRSEQVFTPHQQQLFTAYIKQLVI
jgi:hypothetical protein